MANKKILLDLIGIELLALIVVVGYKLSPMLLPRADLALAPDPACHLERQACSVAVPGGGTITLSLGEGPVPVVKPFAVSVTARGFAPDRVEVDFAGVDMNMGLNRPRLAEQGGGVFVGEAALPVCITGRMQWQATVLVERGRERIAVPYRFSAGGAA